MLKFWLMLSFASLALLVAGEVGGVKLPDTLQADGKPLVLNGAGLRKKMGFVKVYAGALYAAAKSKDAAKLIAADEPMVMRMHFIYDGVEPEKLQDAWNEGFQNATKGNTASIKKEIDAFNALFKVAAKKNDVFDVFYLPGTGIRLDINGKTVGVVACKLEFKKAVFAIWLGEKPADEGLKKGLLGS